MRRSTTQAACRATTSASQRDAQETERGSWLPFLRTPTAIVELVVLDVFGKLIRAVGQDQMLHVNEVLARIARRLAANRHLVAGLHFLPGPTGANQLRLRAA